MARIVKRMNIVQPVGATLLIRTLLCIIAPTTVLGAILLTAHLGRCRECACRQPRC